ncbi:MAG TPA: Rieske (2Fe-2S) protein [Candidatus Acidoferrales bacterium]|nr:Rieske (2Fe-2S) protein [Candidatus Acidoferrales bacterium]
MREWFRSRKAPERVIASEGEIPIGGFKIFSYPRNDTPCILIRPAEQSYLAFSRICTHNSCPVAYNSVRGEFDCPCHGGIFSASDGSVLAGPPRRPLPRIRLQRRGGQIVATGVAET